MNVQHFPRKLIFMQITALRSFFYSAKEKIYMCFQFFRVSFKNSFSVKSYQRIKLISTSALKIISTRTTKFDLLSKILPANEILSNLVNTAIAFPGYKGMY